MNQSMSSFSSAPFSPRRRPSHHQDDDFKVLEEDESTGREERGGRDGRAGQENDGNEEQQMLLLRAGLAGDSGGDEETSSFLHVGSPSSKATSCGWLTREGLMNAMRIMVLAAFSACVLFFAVLTFSSRPVAVNPGFRRPASDFVLGPNWDFDAPPTTRKYTWEIENVIANPDGIFRPIITIDGKFPGPMVEANEGDTVRFNIINRAKNSTSIHFHGLFQNGTNWMDGAPGVTQCPIPPGHSFTYEFTLDQSGTYMYHAHHGAQALDGLFGPFIIHSPIEKFSEYDTDQVVLVQDWYHDLSAGLMFKKLSPGSESSPVPDGALINGQNKVDCIDFPGRHCDTSKLSTPSVELPLGSPHRLRIINTGGFAWFDVSIDGHANVLQMVEVDGVAIEPTPEHKIVLGPGQRYSVVVQQPPDTNPGENFWIRAHVIKECITGTVPGSGEAMARLSYQDTKSSVQSSKPRQTRGRRRKRAKKPPSPPRWRKSKPATECKDMKSTAYKPVPAVDAPEVADRSWDMVVNMKIGDWRLERGFVNGSSFRPQVGSPTLHRIVDGLHEGNESFSIAGVNEKAFHLPHELVISQDSIEVVDLVLQNLDEGNHPFHLHGYQMFVLAQGHGYFPGYESLGLAPKGKGLLPGTKVESSVLSNPLRRDTATIEGFGWLLVRFVADNPGLWYFHCHIAWHEGGGMGMQFASRLDVMKSWKMPRANLDLCSVDFSELSKGSPPEDSFWEGSGLG
ncbi:hypothetical protein MKZ38_002897 [Zalerion maritima]|uniref:Multicopper oxidase n=1 Tax=Zalerion maritima TaxID=339359 RepID=A0AAD5RPE1_9PEZI|nr:hypothetical protein MKZ38_002897 [Zalerion maritima]